MATKIVVPSLGESIVDATIARWYKQVGDKVSSGEKLVELETDKVNLDVGAERNGILSKIEHKEGDDVKVGEVLGVIDESAPQESQPSPQPQPESATPEKPPKTQSPTPVESAPSKDGEKERVTPVARRMAQELGIDAEQIASRHPGARVTKQDVEQLAAQQRQPSTVIAPPSEPQQQPEPAQEPEQPAADKPIPQPAATISEREERVPMSRRRRTIAQRLVEAQHNAAMLTTFNDADMTGVMEIRNRRKEEFKQKYQVSLGFTSFFVKASINALKSFPMVNAELRGDDLIMKHYYDIGVAIGSEEGLVVPVLRNADRMSFGEMEKAIHAFVQKTNEGNLTVEDLRGGTFTITNGGVFGSLLSTPILNAPQVAILGLHRIEDRPIAVNNQVVIRPMMYLALSYDHRVIDGREAVQFLKRIKEVIENPEMLLLEL